MKRNNYKANIRSKKLISLIITETMNLLLVNETTEIIIFDLNILLF